MHRKCYACARYMHVYCGPVLHGKPYINCYANTADYIQLFNQCLHAATTAHITAIIILCYFDNLHDQLPL